MHKEINAYGRQAFTLIPALLLQATDVSTVIWLNKFGIIPGRFFINLSVQIADCVFGDCFCFKSE